jgi:uncharacterized OB-fold protein
MKRVFTVKVPPADILSAYHELKSVEGKVVGWLCNECGRLYEAPHRDDCAAGKGRNK